MRGTLAWCKVSDSKEEGLQPLLLVTGRQRDAVSQHRGLSSGVASGKSVGSRYAYSWVETSTPLSSYITPGVIPDKCFAFGILKYMYSDNYAHKLWNYEWFHYENVYVVFRSVLVVVYCMERLRMACVLINSLFICVLISFRLHDWFPGGRYPYPPQIIPWVNLPIEIPSLNNPSRTRKVNVKE